MAVKKQNELSWYVENFEETWFDVIGQSDIIDLAYEDLSSILSSNKLNVKKENLIWSVIHDWVNFDDSRLKHLPDLIRDCLRIGRLPNQFIENNILNCDLFTLLHAEDQLDLKIFIDNVLKGEEGKETTIDGFNLPYSPTNTYFRPRETKQFLVCISDFVEFFDYQRNSWHSSSFKLPTKQTNFQIELLDDGTGSTLYALGGSDKEGFASNKVWSRDLGQPSSQWTAIQSMKNGRNYFSSVIINDTIYALGGRFTSDDLKINTLKSCERYDSQRNTWSTVASMNIARSFASAIVYDGFIYIAGGINEIDIVESSVERYDPQLNTWTLVVPMINPRCGFVLTSFEGHLWAIGGFDGKQPLSSVESFILKANRWRAKASLDEGRIGHSAVEFNSELYAVGGCKSIEKKENSKLNVSNSVQAVEKYVPGEGWCKVGMLQNSHANAKLIIVPNDFSILFTTGSNQNAIQNNVKENNVQGDQILKKITNKLPKLSFATKINSQIREKFSNFDEIINKIELTLSGLSFRNVNEGNLTITENNFKIWKEHVHTNLLPWYTQNNFDLNNLKMIIVGSSGVRRYNDALAMICTDPKPYLVPPTVIRLIESLFFAFRDSKNTFSSQNKKFKIKDFDYGCKQLAQNVFFINVCLTTKNENFTNVVCSIRLINELLEEAEKNKNKIAVLDFRLVQHKHEDDISGSFFVENKFKREDFLQTDNVFKILNTNNYHDLYSFCHPLSLKIPNVYFTSMFQELDTKGYPIRKMYMPPGKKW